MWLSLANAAELVVFMVIDTMIKIIHALKMPDDVNNLFSTGIYICSNECEVHVQLGFLIAIDTIGHSSNSWISHKSPTNLNCVKSCTAFRMCVYRLQRTSTECHYGH